MKLRPKAKTFTFSLHLFKKVYAEQSKTGKFSELKYEK